MPKQISSLWVGISGNISGLSKAAAGAIAPIRSIGSAVTGASASIGSLGGKMLALTGIGAAVGAALGAIGGIASGISLAAELEQTGVAFETMLGSAGAAQAMMGQLKTFAASTPFQFPEIASSAKMLLGMGVSSDVVTDKMRMLGDIAAGTGKPLNELAKIYGKIKSTGRLQGDTLAMLAEGGVPIYKALSKQLGIAEADVAKLVSTGKVGFDQVDKALQSMTASGGQYAGLTEKQSKTLGGLWSTLTDSVSMSMAGLVQTVVDAFGIKDGLTSLTGALDTAGGAVTGWVKWAAPQIKAFAVAAYNGFRSLYQQAAPIVGRVFAVVSGVFSKLVPLALNVGRGIWNAVTGAWTAVYNFVAPVVRGIVDFVAANWRQSVVTTTGYLMAGWGVIRSVWGAITDLAGWVWGKVTAVWQWGASLITGTTQDAGSSTRTIFQGMADAGRWLQEKLTYAFRVTSYAITHWRDGLDVVVFSAGHTLIKFAAQVRYLFADVIPAVVRWFADDWQAILTDVFNWSGTVFSNLASNVVKILTSIPELISGRVSFSELWTPLTEGFERTSKELVIPDRVIGDMEKGWGDAAAAAGRAYSQGLGKYIADEEQKAKDAARAISDGITGALSPDAGKIEAPKIEAPEAPKVPPVTLKPQLTEDNLGLTVTPEIKRASAVIAGSAEAQMLRFGGFAQVGATAPAAAAAGGGLTAPGIPAAAQPAAPRVAQSRGMADITKDLLTKALEEAKKQTRLQTKIESNTRGGRLVAAAL